MRTDSRWFEITADSRSDPPRLSVRARNHWFPQAKGGGTTRALAAATAPLAWVPGGETFSPLCAAPAAPAAQPPLSGFLYACRTQTFNAEHRRFRPPGLTLRSEVREPKGLPLTRAAQGGVVPSRTEGTPVSASTRGSTEIATQPHPNSQTPSTEARIPNFKYRTPLPRSLMPNPAPRTSGTEHRASNIEHRHRTSNIECRETPPRLLVLRDASADCHEPHKPSLPV